MSTPAVGIEEHIRNRVRAARAAYKAAFESKDYVAIARESLEVTDAETALERYIHTRDEELAKVKPAVRRRA